MKLPFITQNNKYKLKEGLDFDIVLEAQEIYDRLSKLNPTQLENTVNSILNKLKMIINEVG